MDSSWGQRSSLCPQHWQVDSYRCTTREVLFSILRDLVVTIIGKFKREVYEGLEGSHRHHLLLIYSSQEKEMAAHPSILAWRILWTEEPGGLLSIGSYRVGHD